MNNNSSGFVKNVLKLATGTVFAQGLGILIAPVITRLFLPEAYGVSALFTSIVTVFGVVACLRYELSIVLPKTDEEAANLLGASIISVLIVSCVCALVVIFAQTSIIRLLNRPELEKYLWLIPISVFLSGIFLALIYWNTRTKDYGRISFATVISSTTSNSIKLGMGLAGYAGSGSLIGANIISKLVSTAFLGSKIWKNDKILFKKKIGLSKILDGFRRHKNFPIYSTWDAFINSASHQLPMYILSFFFSSKVLGFYALSLTIINMPLRMIGNAISRVFFQEASESKNSIKDLSYLTESVFNMLSLVGFYPALLLALIGKELFIVFFGSNWAEAGIYSQIFSPWLFFVFISSPITPIYIIFEKQRIGLFFNTGLFFSRALSLIIGGIIGNIHIALFLFSATGSILYGILVIWLLYIAGVELIHLFKKTGKLIIYIIPLIGVIALTKWSLIITPLGVVIVGFITTAIYYSALYLRNSMIKELSISIFKQIKSVTILGK